MNRSDLIAALAERAGTSTTDTDRLLAALASVVTECLVSGDRVALPGFVTFEAIDRAGRTGRNPRTGETLVIPARRVPRLTAGAALKRAVAAG